MLERLLQRWIPRNRLGSGLILSIIRMCLLFLAVSLFSYYLIRVYIINEYQMINNLETMQNNVLLLQKTLIDQETGQRGYGLTGQQEFLEPYETGSQQYEQIAQTLKTQSAGDSALHSHVQTLIDKGQIWHNSYGVPLIQKVSQGGHVTAFDLKNGKAAFDDFRVTAGQVGQLLDQKQSEERSRLFSSVNMILVALSVITVIVGFFIIGMLVRRFKKMIEPINQLAGAVSAYSERDFDVAVPSSSFDDELSRLFAGVDQMRTELKKRFLAEQKRTQFSQTLVRLQENVFQEVEYMEAAQLMAQELHRFTDADHVAVLELTEGRFHVLGSSGMNSSPERWFDLADTKLPEMIKHRAPWMQPHWTPEIQEREYNQYLSQKYGIQASVHLPLYAENKCFAMIHFSWCQPIEVTEEDAQFYEELMSLLSTALWSARLWTQTQQLAARDGLTGIWNLRYFDDKLQEAIAQAHRSHDPLCLVMLDVDHFKKSNDTYGHLEGDRLLRHVASLLEQNTRPQDVAARYGGEEFALILPDTSLEVAVQIAERLRQKVKLERLEHYQITASFGVARLQPDDVAPSLIERTDRLLYQAKNKGRDQVETSLETM